MTTTEAFVRSIEDYLQAAGMTATTFGTKAVADPNFVHDLRRGRTPSLRLADRVSRFMAENPPPARGAAG